MNNLITPPQSPQSSLSKPLEKTEWHCYRVLLPIKTDSWFAIKSHSKIHLIGPTQDRMYFQVAAREDGRQYMKTQELEGYLHRELQCGPSKIEKDIYGSDKAKVRATRKLIQTGISGICSGGDRGLLEFYRQHVHESVCASIQWGVLINDIINAEPDVLVHFVSRGLLISFPQHPHCTSIENLIENLSIWRSHFDHMEGDKYLMSAKNPKKASYEVLLLRNLLQWHAGDPWQPPESERSLNTDIKTLAGLFTLNPAVAYIQPEAEYYISTPFGFPPDYYDVFPAKWIHIISQKAVISMHAEALRLFQDSSPLEKPSAAESYESLFLCLCACFNAGNRALKEALNSKDGRLMRERIVNRVHGSLSSDAAVLGFLALLSYEKLAVSANQTMTWSPYGSHVHAFRRLLEGDAAEDQFSVLVHALTSLRGHPCIGSTLSTVIDKVIVTYPRQEEMDPFHEYWEQQNKFHVG